MAVWQPDASCSVLSKLSFPGVMLCMTQTSLTAQSSSSTLESLTQHPARENIHLLWLRVGQRGQTPHHSSLMLHYPLNCRHLSLSAVAHRAAPLSLLAEATGHLERSKWEKVLDHACTVWQHSPYRARLQNNWTFPPKQLSRIFYLLRLRNQCLFTN